MTYLYLKRVGLYYYCVHDLIFYAAAIKNGSARHCVLIFSTYTQAMKLCSKEVNRQLMTTVRVGD